MKHLLTFVLLVLGLIACSSYIVENRETRSTVYRGQTTWDLYENFGAPTFAVRVSPNEVHFVYRKEEITRDWTQLYFDWCDKVFVVVDDRVVAWDVNGNQCYLNVADDVPMPDEENTRQNVRQRYSGNMMTSYAEVEDYEYSDDEETLF